MFAVVAELHQVIGLGRQRELRVDDLVTIVSQARRRLDAPEEVRVPDERAVEERRLVNDAYSALHRLERPRLGLTILLHARLRAIELHDLTRVALDQGVEVPLLVLFALTADQLGAFVLRVGAKESLSRHQRLELGEPFTLEVVIEIAGGVNEASVETLHIGGAVFEFCKDEAFDVNERIAHAWNAARRQK